MRLLVALLLLISAAMTQAQTIETRLDGAIARFEGPTDRYGHRIMGDLPEWSRLCLETKGIEACIDLPETSVFEDIAPRLADMDGDGTPEAVVVESSTHAGASLVIYQRVETSLKRVSTPAIGRRNRWLSPVGIADFNADGKMDVAYVETPHLGKVLKIYSWNDGHLILSATASGLSNHRIGDETITSGIRDCGKGPEIVLPSGNWTRVYSGRFEDGQLEFEELGRFTGQKDFVEYLSC